MALIVPSDGRGWFWLQAGVADGGRLSLFLNQGTMAWHGGQCRPAARIVAGRTGENAEHGFLRAALAGLGCCSAAGWRRSVRLRHRRTAREGPSKSTDGDCTGAGGISRLLCCLAVLPRRIVG